MKNENKAKERIGEESMSTNGQKMKIIAYRNTSDIDVQFEDGNVVKHKSYSHFKEGKISPSSNEKENRLGETRTMNCGLEATIINYNNNKDVDIKFEDGAIAEHCNYHAFKNGAIRKPIPSRIGERNKNSKGEEFEIVEYKNSRDITIKFLNDGTILKHKDYSTFKNGHIGHPNYKNKRYIPD